MKDIYGGKAQVEASQFQKSNVFQNNEELVKKAQEGNEDALNTLCAQNQRLVMKYAARYTGMFDNKLSIEDLISAGNIGLMKAVERFNYNLGYAFSTYAVWWIRQAIFREIADNGYTIRIPVHMYDKINKISKIERKLADMDLTSPECISAIAMKLDSSEDQVMECIKLRQQIMKCTSLDNPINDDTELTRIDIVSTDEKDNPANLVVQKCMRSDIMDVLETLSTQEKQIVIKRYGLDGMGRRTLEEIAREIGVTRERIRQIERKALLKLSHSSRSSKLKEYLEVIA